MSKKESPKRPRKSAYLGETRSHFQSLDHLVKNEVEYILENHVEKV